MISVELFSFLFPTGTHSFQARVNLQSGHCTERHQSGLVDFVQVSSE